MDSSAGQLRSVSVDPRRDLVILVNIAGAEAIAREVGREVLRTRVIVRSGRSPTPEFSSPVASVPLNPPRYVRASSEQEMSNAGLTFD